MLADRIVVVLQPTIPAISDGLKVQEYATTYDTDVAGLLYNKVRESESIEQVSEKTERTSTGRRSRQFPRASAPAKHAVLAGHSLLTPPNVRRQQPTERPQRRSRPNGTAADAADRFQSAVSPESL